MLSLASKFAVALEQVRAERSRALAQHGPLKPGPARWSRLMAEEWQEVEDELAILELLATGLTTWDREDMAAAKVRTVEELGQLAQLCIGVIELIQEGRIYEHQVQ